MIHRRSLPAAEAIALVESLPNFDRRKHPPAVLLLLKPPQTDAVPITAEQVEQEHGLQNVPHNESTVLPVARERKLEARAERGKHPHREELNDRQVFIVGLDLAKLIRQFHCTFNNNEMQKETFVRRDDFERSITQELFLDVKRSKVSRKHFLGHADVRRSSQWDGL